MTLDRSEVRRRAQQWLEDYRKVSPWVLTTRTGAAVPLIEYLLTLLDGQEPPKEGTMPKKIEMWAIQHVPSGSWDHGHATLMLYPTEHEARLACVNSAFVPIKVIVAEGKK